MRFAYVVLLAVCLAAAGCGDDDDDACVLLNVTGDTAAMSTVTSLEFRLFQESATAVAYPEAGEVFATRTYASGIPTSLVACRGEATPQVLKARLFGTATDGKLAAASSIVELTFSARAELSVYLSNSGITAADVPTLPPVIVPSSFGLGIEQLVADMKTPIAGPGLVMPAIIGVGDGIRSYIGMGMRVNGATPDWATQYPSGTPWPFSWPGLVLLMGNGHVDNGTWRIEIANVDMQVYSLAAGGWLRPEAYPANPAGLRYQGPNEVTTAAVNRPGTLDLSTIYTMPPPGTLGTNIPALIAAVPPGYLAEGDGSDVYSVFHSVQVRFVPSGTGTFDPSGAVIYLRLVDEIMQTAGGEASNSNSTAGRRVTADLQTFTFSLFVDEATMDVFTTTEPNALDGAPDEAWLRAHPPIGIVP